MPTNRDLLHVVLFVVAAGSAVAQVRGGAGARGGSEAVAPAVVGAAEERFLGVFAAADGLELEVRAAAAGRGLLLVPRSARSAARLVSGRAPEPATDAALRVVDERVQRGLAPFVRGRGESDREVFVDSVAQAAAQKVMARAAAAVAAREVAVVGADLAQRRALLLLRGRTSECLLEVKWSGSGRFASVADHKEPVPAVPLAVVRADWATATRGTSESAPVAPGGARPAPSATTLSVEGSLARRVLVLEDASGLVELAWVRDVR